MSIKSQRGYILFLTLASIVTLTLISTMSMDVIDSNIERALAQKSRLQYEVDKQNTLSFLYYALGRQKSETAGLRLLNSNEFINVNGTPYKGFGDVIFTIEDQNSFTNINIVTPEQFELFELSGLIKQSTRSFFAQRKDYVDVDDWAIPGGAESPAYNARGLPGPANGVFRHPAEILNLPIVHNNNITVLSEFDWRKITTLGNTAINLNSAPIELIATLPGLDGVELSPLAEFRMNGGKITSVNDLRTILSLPQSFTLDYYHFNLGFSKNLRISIWQRGKTGGLEYNFVLTPNDISDKQIRYVRNAQIPAEWNAKPAKDTFILAFQSQNRSAN